MKFDIHSLLASRYAQWIIISLVSLFSILIIIAYASLFFSIPNVAPSTALNTAFEGEKKEASFDSVLNANLFGVYVSGDLNEDNVKKSMLNVTLAGIMQADKNDESQVIIRSAGGDEKTYKIGDKIPGGAVIKRIMANGVLVERNGALESLGLPKNDLVFEPVPKPLKEE